MPTTTLQVLIASVTILGLIGAIFAVRDSYKFYKEVCADDDEKSKS